MGLNSGVIENHLPDVHCFADDIQLYLPFKPYSRSNFDEAVLAMENRISDLKRWKFQDELNINDSKPEFLIIGSKQQLLKLDLNTCSVRLGSTDIHSVSSVPNLGSYFDSNLSMPVHVNKVCSAACFGFITSNVLVNFYLVTN